MRVRCLSSSRRRRHSHRPVAFGGPGYAERLQHVASRGSRMAVTSWAACAAGPEANPMTSATWADVVVPCIGDHRDRLTQTASLDRTKAMARKGESPVETGPPRSLEPRRRLEIWPPASRVKRTGPGPADEPWTVTVVNEIRRCTTSRSTRTTHGQGDPHRGGRGGDETARGGRPRKKGEYYFQCEYHRR